MLAVPTIMLTIGNTTRGVVGLEADLLGTVAQMRETKSHDESRCR
jgi:hypothetical protein